MKRNYLLMVMLFCLAMVVGCEKAEKEKEKGEEGIEHHPTSSFDKCPLLAHVDNPKLGIKQITLFRGDDTNAFFYDENQKLIKIIYGYQTKDEYIVVYTYDNEGRMTKGGKAEYGYGTIQTWTYDKYGFLTEEKTSYADGDVDRVLFTYEGKTVTKTGYDNDERSGVSVILFDDDMHKIEEKQTRYENATTPTETTTTYKWQNGNKIRSSSGSDSTDFYLYVYDEHHSISSLTMDINDKIRGNHSKNNNIAMNIRSSNLGYLTWTYKYNAKGFVEESQHKSYTYPQDTTYYEYIYY